jgi:F-box and WD-40 domain protein 1/11
MAGQQCVSTASLGKNGFVTPAPDSDHVVVSVLKMLTLAAELTMALLEELPTSTIASIVQRLSPRLYIDFIKHLPAEICLKILGYLDPVSLVCVLQTCRAWNDLALDRKLWEKLYCLEGWKAVYKEIEDAEARENEKVTTSIGAIHSHSSDEPASKVRALMNDDEDMEMVDSDRPQPTRDGVFGASMFGSPTSSFSSSRRAATPMGDVEMTSFSGKGKSVDRSFGSNDARAKRKAPGVSPDPSTPLTTVAESKSIRSGLFTWDVPSSRYRINWKYIYNMRRRLESNWELGKFSTFMLPHPDYPEEGHQECVYTIQFDANYLVSGSRDRTMRIWNMHTRRLVRPPLAGHHGSVLCLQFDADPEEDIIVSGSSDSNIFIWKFSTGEILQRITKAHRESVLNVRFDKRILVTSSKDKTIKIFNRRPLHYGDLGYAMADSVVSPVAKTVKPYGYEPDLAQELPVKPPYTMIGRLDGHGAAVNAIQVKGRTIVSVSGDRQVKVWDWPDQICIRTIPAHDKGIACVEFDERRIVSGSSDYEVCIFDAPTGLKVASLRGHANLVRTVQAGFGDFPYSKIEDEIEARAVDAEYFKAIETGDLGSESDRRARRGRRANAGSSRPADVQVFGAKVPPGGGGGRKYGRIVSGSYDQSIIIWRRDKEGVWKPAHHLRQEEAAELAQRRHATQTASQVPAAATQGVIPFHPVSRTQPASSRAAMPALQDPGNSLSQRSAGLYMALIDQVVPNGAASLQQALASYPAMLFHHNYLQATIEREPSLFVRSQLRQVVTSALVNVQTNQSSRQRLISATQPTQTPQVGSSASVAAGPSSSTAATAGSQSSPQAPGSNDANHGSVDSSSGDQQSASQQAGSSAPQATSARPSQSQSHQQQQQTINSATPQVSAPVQTPAVLATAQPSAAQQQQQQQQQHHQHQPPQQPHHHHTHRHHHHHHPHIAAAENAPARVFKLQFDARKIVCCTQSPVIVGWDFCNGEKELEEVSRFFATLD